MDDLLDLLFLFIKPSDWLALIVAAGIGYFAGSLAPAGWLSILISMLLSYHLFLGWLVLRAGDDKQMARPSGSIAITHFVYLAVIVSLGMGRKIVPHFDVVCCGVAVLAFFESDWLLQPIKGKALNAAQRR
jgi:hypothetical protein